MEIIVVNVCKEVRNYIDRVKKGDSPETCWEEEVISKYWEQLCIYAPFDLIERKPKPITDIDILNMQCEILEKIDISLLKQEFSRITTILKNYDEDPITVALFPGDMENIYVNEKQNGVVGTSLFGNILIQVNPFIEGYEEWIKYVFAHEYHHTVWGNYWFNIHGGELNNKFIDSLVIDGEADSFALQLYPDLKPQWLFGMSNEEIQDVWNEKYKNLVFDTDVDYVTYMFGNEALGIPWCAGYAIGYFVVQEYLKTVNKDVVDILEVKPEEILKKTLL